MDNNLEIVAHFYSLDELDDAMDLLVDAGLSPRSQEEVHQSNNGDGGVYALLVRVNWSKQKRF